MYLLHNSSGDQQDIGDQGNPYLHGIGRQGRSVGDYEDYP